MRGIVVIALCAAGCANSGILVGDDDAAPAQDGGGDVFQLPLDAGSDASDAAIDVFDAGCAKDAALGGIGVPAGSTASATTTYASQTPDLAVDGDEGTYWNSGGFAGSITVKFPAPVTFDGVKLFVSALPTTSETYTVYGIQDANVNPLAQSTQTAQQSGGALQTIAIPNDAYDGIRIDVDGNQSWVAINEIALVTAYCP